MNAELEVLKKSSVFRDFDDESLSIVFSLLDQRIVGAGIKLFAEGDAGDALYFVNSGRVRLTKLNKGSGLRVRVCDIGPGTVIGEMSLLRNSRRSTTATAVCTSELWKLSRTRFRAIRNTDAHIYALLMKNLVTVLCQRLETVNINFTGLLEKLLRASGKRSELQEKLNACREGLASFLIGAI